jgi:hypothetical protein
VLIRAVKADPLDGYGRDLSASGVMMIPIPRRGYYKGVEGMEDARRLPHIQDIAVTAKPDQLIEPLPEGASYLGFIFARAGEPAAVVEALRRAHETLTFAIEPAPTLLP